MAQKKKRDTDSSSSDSDSSDSSSPSSTRRQDNDDNKDTSSSSSSSSSDSNGSNRQNKNQRKVKPPPPPISDASDSSPTSPAKEGTRSSPSSRNPPPPYEDLTPPERSPPPPEALPPPSPPPPEVSPPPPPPPEVSPPPPSFPPPLAQIQSEVASTPPPPPPPYTAPPSPPPPYSPSPPPPPSTPNESSPSPVRPASANSQPKADLATDSPRSFGKATGNTDMGKFAGYTLAAVFFLALVAVTFFMFRKKKSRGDVYGIPRHNLHFHVRPGVDRIYYGQKAGVGNGPILSPNRSNHGSARNPGSRLLAPSDIGQQVNAPVAFSYEDILQVTNSFSDENVIGEGGFGHVYKGTLPDGKVVAVKKLKVGSGQGEREFRAEVEIISRVHHRHLVSLVGYCICEDQRLLVYEYVPNGTLHHHLHGSGMPVLTWDKRCKIAIGAAKGLAYLHEECSQKIIHRDIKSANILLDDTFEAQVADFGLARLTDTTKSHVSTRVMGTFGYMAPEYATSGKLTDRSDVFSFGVVLLELLTGRKPVDDSQPLGDESLVEWARPHLLHAMETHDYSVLVDPRLQNQFAEAEMLRMIEAAAACVRHSAPKRPRMVQVVRALDSGAEISDLSNGVKYGHSTNYDSNQYDKDIRMFRRMANGSYGGDSDSDKYSKESSLSREMSTCGSQNGSGTSSSSSDLESIALTKHSRSSS
ncbi:proline-rich receptor-like protein kinase PERK8 [Arachis ipaensis]|uniref:non-specific serine/threonine protein kinase n=1 Tax=Arachis hypogaea TaxID=3818 RepID=A0A444ZVE9_ARAHY|nr:proline-rich receptor-like protein kinase PERK8 [Arachis ipaensis]XP_025638801.1 proline-rich receptor-like protein kinase PERK8 [Arachis hypogaea]QHO03152.1 Proline-rich receptor-like protein kinase [Arachis hypogaea]RYR18138.1 hypothetical protein Ahy_B03g062766 isoform B [Arachis hypogaea]